MLGSTQLDRPPRDASRRRTGRPFGARVLGAGLLAVATIGGLLAPQLTGSALAQDGGTRQSPAPTFAADYLDGVSGPRPARTVDLSGTWDFTPVTTTECVGGGRFGTTTGPMTCTSSPADGTRTTIQVPGGGWVKQGFDDVSEAVYSRTIRVPYVSGGQVTKLEFGAINHEATVRVDGRVVGTQTTSYTTSTFDISGFVRPGATHLIEVSVKGRKALVGPDGRYTVPEGASWSDDVAQGIFRSADLQVFPAVYVADTVVRTSVAEQELTYDVHVTNSTPDNRVVTLEGSLRSWNRVGWVYPSIPRQQVVVPANTTATVTVGPLRWRAGEKSYWTPNVPYKAGYTAQLHDLDIRTTSRPEDERSAKFKATTHAEAGVRFGFREMRQVGDHYELNGTRINLRGDSLQGANYDNIDNHGRGDAFDTLPGFLEPSAGNGGWPQAVDNYQRLNYNSVRIHQLPATPYMLDVADEKGLIVTDETAIRGSNNRENFELGRDNMVEHLADLVRRDRNHASVVRWSQSNEPQMPFFTNPGQGAAFDELLYQTVKSLDATRPVSTDGDSPDLPHDDYTVFCHYEGDQGQFAVAQYTENVCEVPGKPNGQGEFIWYSDHTPQGFTWFATSTMRMREKGAEDTRPYTLLDAWTSVIPGVKRTDLTIEFGYPNGAHPLYGADNLPDPWSNPQIQLVQKAFNPMAAIDSAFWAENKLSDQAGTFPVAPSTITAGPTTRTLTVFNDTLAGERVHVNWKLHAGTATGKVVAQDTVRTDIALGTHQQLPVSFNAPAGAGPLYLELEVSKPGQGVLFRDTSTTYRVQR